MGRSASCPRKLCYSAATSARTSQVEQGWVQHKSGETSQLGRGGLIVPALVRGLLESCGHIAIQNHWTNLLSTKCPKFFLCPKFLLCLCTKIHLAGLGSGPLFCSPSISKNRGRSSHTEQAFAWKLRLSSWIGSSGSRPPRLCKFFYH